MKKYDCDHCSYSKETCQFACTVMDVEEVKEYEDSGMGGDYPDWEDFLRKEAKNGN